MLGPSVLQENLVNVATTTGCNLSSELEVATREVAARIVQNLI